MMNNEHKKRLDALTMLSSLFLYSLRSVIA